MLENEDRKCKDSCCEKKDTIDIPMYSFEFTKISDKEDISCKEKQETREDMMNKIRSLSFSVVELAEYLDTHPDDRKAIMLHNEYANKLYNLRDKYQMVYGPLTIECPCNKWRWIEGLWPWERGSI